MARVLQFLIKPRENGDGFNVISEELGFVIRSETLETALLYAKRKAGSHALQIEICDEYGEVVEHLEFGPWNPDALG
jgi:hypothetical protein